jgi:phage RecT family recombinase
MTAKALTLKNKADDTRSMLLAPHRLETMAAVLPTGFAPKRMVELAIQAMILDPQIFDCTQLSIYTALMGAAQAGFEINPASGSAYIVKYGDRATLIPGYQGYKDLAWESGLVSGLSMEVICEKDFFDYEMGTSAFLRHKLPMDEPRGPVTGSYALVNYANGGVDFAIVTLPELNDIRNMVLKRTPKSPWGNPEHFPGMCKVAAFRKLRKLMPRKAIGSRLAIAGALEDAADLGVNQANVIDLPADDVRDLGGETTTGTDALKDALSNTATEPPAPATPSQAAMAAQAPVDTDEATPEEQFVCGDCGLVAKSGRGLTQHKKSKHERRGAAEEQPDEGAGPQGAEPEDPPPPEGSAAEARAAAEAEAAAFRELQAVDQFLEDAAMGEEASAPEPVAPEPVRQYTYDQVADAIGAITSVDDIAVRYEEIKEGQFGTFAGLEMEMIEQLFVLQKLQVEAVQN